MQQDSIAAQIFNRIEQAHQHSIYVTADFLDLGEYHTVRQALLRLEKSGNIQKVMRGVYYKPQYNELIDEYEAPSPSSVAEALARKFNWTIAPYGDTALNLLGLSAQIPTKWSYISDGPYHKFQAGNLMIEFKHRNNREISGMSQITAIVIQAIKALGKESVEDFHINIIRQKLTTADRNTLLSEAKQSTMWVYDVIKQICI